MIIELTPQTIITAGAAISALGVIIALFVKVVKFVDRQKAQDEEIKHSKEERTILVYGVLACLKGLKEQGCNGPVTEAISMIEKHLNKEAHR